MIEQLPFTYIELTTQTTQGETFKHLQSIYLQEVFFFGWSLVRGTKQNDGPLKPRGHDKATNHARGKSGFLLSGSTHQRGRQLTNQPTNQLSQLNYLTNHLFERSPAQICR